MKELPYFKFYVDEYLTGDIRYCSYETQGVFSILASLLWKKNGYLPMDIEKLSKITGIDIICLTNAYHELFGNGIIHENNDKNIFMKFIIEQLEEAKNIQLKRSFAGKTDKKKQVFNKCSSNDNQMPNNAQSRDEDEDEDKEEDKDIKKESVKKIFTPPTLEEFKLYCENELKEYDLDPVNIFKGYEVAEWTDSQGNKIKNWKQKLRQVWCRKQKNYQGQLSIGQKIEQKGELGKWNKLN